jgi:hypothetical protein
MCAIHAQAQSDFLIRRPRLLDRRFFGLKEVRQCVANAAPPNVGAFWPSRHVARSKLAAAAAHARDNWPEIRSTAGETGMRGIFEQAVRDEAVLQAALADADIFCWAASGRHQRVRKPSQPGDRHFAVAPVGRLAADTALCPGGVRANRPGYRPVLSGQGAAGVSSNTKGGSGSCA